MGLLAFICNFVLGIIRSVLGENCFKYLYLQYWRLTLRKKECRFAPLDLNSNDSLEKLDYFISKEDKVLDYRRPIENKETDSILFFGANSKKDKLLARVSVNAQGQSTTWLQIWLSDGRSFSKDCLDVYNVPITTDDCFVGGGLRMRCLVPFRKWKISYNGTLQQNDATGSTKDVHARLSLSWTSLATPHDLKTDITTTSWANFYAEQKGSPVDNVTVDLDSIVQHGFAVGALEIVGEEEINLELWGSRKRSLERNQADSPEQFEVLFSTKEGMAFHVGDFEFPNVKPRLDYAYAVVKNAKFRYISKIKSTFDNEELRTISLSSDPWDFNLKFDKPILQLSYPTLESNNEILVKIAYGTTEDDAGTAIIIRHSRGNPSNNATLKRPSLLIPRIIQGCKTPRLVLSLNETDCRNAMLTGGKGSSLGCLNYIKDKVVPQYSVPRGIVVTTEAYTEFVKAVSLLREVKKLEAVAWTEKSDVRKENKVDEIGVQNICEKVVEYVRAQELPLKITQAVEVKLEAVFGKDLSKLRFAVRSSASGEDSEELSAAGQMQTFLGVAGLSKIIEAIVDCWASQFSFTAIQYKKQNGQLLNSPMAVVVQEMVPAEVAGVLFTSDPVTGNPKNITLTANYGIGESVVSASADPDTIVFERSSDNSVTLKSVMVGGKATQTVMTDDGVQDVVIEESKRKKCCLPNDLAKDLSRISLKIEEAYGCPLDLEWAVSKGGLYLLQARPITTVDQDSDNFLEIEMSTAVRNEREYFSRANIGEVMSGSMSPLGLLSMMTMMNIQAYRFYNPRDSKMFNFDRYAQMMSCQFYYQGFFNMNDYIFRFFSKEEKSFVTDSLMIACFGRLLYDEEHQEMLDIADRRNKYHESTSFLRSLYYIITDAMFCKSRVLRDTKLSRHISIKVNETDSPAKMLASIIAQYSAMHMLMARHMESTMTTSMVNCAVMQVLVSAAGGWTIEVFNDLSRILSSCPDVESADVPAAMEDLARVLIQSPSKEEFVNFSPGDALNWLMQSETQPGKQFAEFIEKHGHRCINEFDVHNRPWGTNPIPLVELLQEMVKKLGASKKKKAVQTASEVIDGLRVPLTTKSRLLLRFLIPWSQRSVGCRELSKSLMVYGLNKLRPAYAKVADKMVSEGRLPASDLFYYLSPKEIGQLLETRSAKLIQKAVRRRHLLPKINEYKFTEIVSGFPRPVNKFRRPDVPVEASFTMKATPVSEGFIKARCRVALSLEDAKQLQPGEILITYGTDIGWSPFFPLLSGIATELGGLVSHGAVVAREYGLPCVVGVHGATEKFRTGDLVILDGTKGLLQKVEE